MTDLTQRLGLRAFGQVAAATVLVFAWFLPSSGAWACSCAPLDNASAFENADEVVGGEVIELNTDAGTARLRVGKRWKGGSAKTLRLRIDGPCGVELLKGEAYLVFALATSQGELVVHQCGGTRVFGSSRGVVTQLEALRAR